MCLVVRRLHEQTALLAWNFDLETLRTVIITLSDLYSIEVQLSSGGSTAGNAGSCTAAHANTVGRPTNLDDQHAHLWRALLQMPVINLTNATTARHIPSLLERLLGSSTCTGIRCLSWLCYLLSAVPGRNPVQSTRRLAQVAVPCSAAASTQHCMLSLTSRCSVGSAAEQSTTLQGPDGRQADCCVGMSHLNMMGLIHSLLLPSGMRMPKVRV